MNEDNKELREGFKKTDLDWIERNDPLYLDSLTNAFNRVAYDVFLPRLIEESQKLGIPLTVAVLDLDSFKIINDTYGSLKGDEKIKEVADKLRPQIRETDYLFRFLGDEFIIAFRDADEKGVSEVIIPRIRQSLGTIGLHVSVGTSSFGEGDDVKTIFERAEQLMRKEKNEKKNV